MTDEQDICRFPLEFQNNRFKPTFGTTSRSVSWTWLKKIGIEESKHTSRSNHDSSQLSGTWNHKDPYPLSHTLEGTLPESVRESTRRHLQGSIRTFVVSEPLCILIEPSVVQLKYIFFVLMSKPTRFKRVWVRKKGGEREGEKVTNG